MKIISLIILTTFLVPLKKQESGKLIIYADNFNNDKGKAILFLFRQNDEIPNGAFKKVNAIIKNKKAEFEVQDLPYGSYAAILLHDENNNNKIDHYLGVPSEQLGYSNGWELGFFSGMPTFEKLKFEFTKNNTPLNISITYKRNKK
jgi:uncharacterized protein (DUF2141 family)